MASIFHSSEIDTEALADFGYRIGIENAGFIVSVVGLRDPENCVMSSDQRFPIIIERCLKPTRAADNSGMSEG